MICRVLRFALIACCLASPCTSAFGQSTKPNIVVILADDLGNADLGYRGSDIKTPNIDALAARGVRLESYYGLPVCTPARAALMTGRYAVRYGLQTLVIFPSHTYGLPTDERTLPQALREVGYNTAMVGKWHLGHADKKFWPQNRGFDHFYGNLVGEVDYFTKERGGLIDWQRDGTFLKEDGYYTNLIGNEAVSLIEHHDTSKPLFLYVASLAPHAPYQAPKEEIDAYKDMIGDHRRRTYAAMITEFDTQVGRIVAALKKKGMLENTLIIFTSDNGGATTRCSPRAHGRPEEREAERRRRARRQAASLERRSPRRQRLAARGRRAGSNHLQLAGQAQAAGRQRAVAMVDVMPTVLALAGAKGSPDHPFDGKDMADHRRGQTVPARRYPDQRGGVPRSDPQGQLEAGQGRVAAGKDRAVRSLEGPRRAEQRRGSVS